MADRPMWCEAAYVDGWGVDRNQEVAHEDLGFLDPDADAIPDDEMRALASIICTVDDARRYAAAVIDQATGNEASCPCCIYRSPSHSDGCPLGCLLTLLSEVSDG